MVVAHSASERIVVDSPVDSATGCCPHSLAGAGVDSPRERSPVSARQFQDVDRDRPSRDRP